MATMFSYTDDKQRTIDWGIEHDPGDPNLDPPRAEATYIVCRIAQTLTTLVDTPDGKKERSVTITGTAKQATAQEAWRIALDTLNAELKGGAAKAREVVTVPTPQTETSQILGDKRG